MAKTTWILDTMHSQVQFKIKHMMITNVSGSFQVLNGAIITNDDFTDTKVNFTIDARSITTGNEHRDKHLKSPDFFDVEEHHTITFECDHYNVKNGKVNGALTVKGIRKPVEFDSVFNGVYKDPWGKTKAGFSISGKISRKEWGLEWNTPLEKGGVLLGDEVGLNAEIQFEKKNP